MLLGEGVKNVHKWGDVIYGQSLFLHYHLSDAAVHHDKELQQLQRGHGLLSRNCSELDWTFYYESPFLHMSLPVCGDVIKPAMILQRQNLTCDLDPGFLPNNVTQTCVTQLLSHGHLSNIIIVIHGFLKSLSSSVWMLQLSDQLLTNSDTAVLLVDWGHGSGSLPFPG